MKISEYLYRIFPMPYLPPIDNPKKEEQAVEEHLRKESSCG